MSADNYTRQDMVVSRREDGSILIVDWGSDEQEFSTTLLALADPSWLTIDGDKLTIHAANGDREYVKIGHTGNCQSVRYRATGPVCCA